MITKSFLNVSLKSETGTSKLDMSVGGTVTTSREKGEIIIQRYVYTHCTAIKTRMITVPCLLHKGQKCSF